MTPLLLFGALFLAAEAAVESSGAAGIVVEDARDGSAAREAPLRPGDVLVRWERSAAQDAGLQGNLGSPLDLDEVEREQAPLGRLTFSGTRHGEAMTVRWPPGRWIVATRPILDEASLHLYDEGRRLVSQGDLARGLALWQQTASRWHGAGRTGDARWLLGRAVRVAAERQECDAAVGALDGGPGPAGRDDGFVAAARTAIGRCFELRGEWAAAAAAFSVALDARRAQGTAPLATALALLDVGRVARKRGDIGAAEAFAGRALEIHERLAPESLDLATSLSNLGMAVWMRGDIDAAREYHQRALDRRLALVPGSREVAASLNWLANVALSRDELEVAESYSRRALAILEATAPIEEELAYTLSNLGILAMKRGDLVAAEDHHRRARGLWDNLGRRSPDVASYLLQQLAAVALCRGDLDGAQAHYREALPLVEARAPESLALAFTLHAVGLVAEARGDESAALGHHGRALSLRERLAPESLLVAQSLERLGLLAGKRGDTAHAERALRRGLAIVDRLAPEGMVAADLTAALGTVALSAGNLLDAERHYRRCLGIRQALAPGSAGAAETYERLATIARRRDDRDTALPLYAAALEILETQRRLLGGADEVQVGFTARYAGVYRATLDLLVEMGRPAEAFHVLERYRARAFLAQLAERDLVFSADVPAELDQERRRANAAYDRALARVSREKSEDRPAGLAALEAARRQQAQVRDTIRSASPRLAALHYPVPLDLEAARAALDPGTLMLSYSIGHERSHVFAVGPGPLDFAVFEIAATGDTLRDALARLRPLLARGARLRTQSLRAEASRLGHLLLAPVADRIAGADRLLIVPDGPLHAVPFAVLADPTSPGRFRHLVEHRPVHVAASATVFAEIARARHAPRPARLVAFGDPDYGAPGALSAPLRAAVERGLDLRPLPASRKEVADIGRAYGALARTYVGAEATEERAKGVGREASLVHFACHGVIDEKSPLDSALALSLPRGAQPGSENGLLQAWEIFEQVRIDADLVTLSACDTALGQELSGEGILGLTRAFQYAGARSVLASLWGVSDRSTAELMRRFYRRLSRGQSKADALRDAQVEMIRRPSSAHPYHWAAFELIGDWR